jgi:quercetin dioxygenase-like cupin family protein
MITAVLYTSHSNRAELKLSGTRKEHIEKRVQLYIYQAFHPFLSSTRSMSSQSTQTPTIISPTHTALTPPESFASPSRGRCTWHTLISSPQTPTDSLSAGIAVCPPLTGSLCPHRHAHAEIYHVLAGSGTVTIEGQEYVVEKGSTVFVPGDAEHGVRNEGQEELRWFYVFAAGSFADIVYRFSSEESIAEVGV